MKAMRRSPRPVAALVAALVLVVSGCGAGGATSAADGRTTDDTSSGSPTTATPAVLDFTSQTVDGDAFDASTLAGKPTVFWFWAPWCPTCRAQISGVGELAETVRRRGQRRGVGSLDEQAAIDGFAAEVSRRRHPARRPRRCGVASARRDRAEHVRRARRRPATEQASGYLDDDELVALVADLVG